MKKLCKYWMKFMKMNIIKAYILALGFHFIWTLFVGIILYLSGAQFSQNVASTSEFTNTFFLIPMCAIAEEMLFRWLPFLLLFTFIGFATKYAKISEETKANTEKYGIITVVIISSAIFGYVHGNLFNILLQGVSGVIFCAFYLRTLFKRRFAGKSVKYQLRPLMSSSLYHTLCNSLLIILWKAGFISLFSLCIIINILLSYKIHSLKIWQNRLKYV